MARKKLVEHNALVQAVEMGHPKEKIMQRFGFKTPAALKVAYYDGLAALDKIQDINKDRKDKTVDNKISVNNRGSLIIPKQLVAQLKISESDSFEVVKNKTGLVLKKVNKPPKTILRKSAARNSERTDSDRTMQVN